MRPRPAHPRRWIAIGFYLGIGLGLAYAACMAGVIAVMACASAVAALFQYADSLVPGEPWIVPAFSIGILALVGLAIFLFCTNPEIMIFRNRRR